MLNSKNGTANGVHRDAAAIGEQDPAASAERDLLWDGLSPAVTRALKEPLDTSLVARRRGRAGRMYDYLEGHVAIDQANRTFGHGGWGYELAAPVALHEIETVDDRTGEVTRVRAYSASVRVTVPGAPVRTDVGFHTVAEESGEGHETAYKGAVTDALKRALRSFGDQFGNSLYGDQAAGDASSRPARSAGPARKTGDGGAAAQDDQTQAGQLRKRLFELGAAQGFNEEQVRAAVRQKTGKDLDELAAAALKSLIEAAAKKAQQRQQQKETG